MYNFELNDPQFLPHIGCDVQFSLLQGEALVIVGENGIGKTSLLKRFTEAFSQKSLGVVEQKALDYFYDYNLQQIKRIQPGIDEYWDQFGLAEKKGRQVSNLSGGELQALKISCALAAHPECLVLDEPSQALDDIKKRILAKILKVCLEDNVAILMVEHDIEWLPHGTKIIKLGISDGKIKVVQSWTT